MNWKKRPGRFVWARRRGRLSVKIKWAERRVGAERELGRGINRRTMRGGKLSKEFSMGFNS